MITYPPFITQAGPLPCRSNPELMFPRSKTELAQAKAVCTPCPVQAACAAWATEHPEQGVWGGRSAQHLRAGARGRAAQELARWQAQRRAAVLGSPPRAERGRLLCGSEDAYRAHFLRREPQDEACLAAHEAHLAVSRPLLLAEAHELGQWGRAYGLHLLLGEPPCAGCRGWRREKAARDRARKRAASAAEGLTAARAGPSVPGAAA